MKEAWLMQVMDRLIQWTMSSGMWVLIVGAGMLLLLSLLKQVIARFRHAYEGTLPGPAQLKRADTLAHVIRDVVEVAGVGRLVEEVR